MMDTHRGAPPNSTQTPLNVTVPKHPFAVLHASEEPKDGSRRSSRSSSSSSDSGNNNLLVSAAAEHHP